MARDARAVSPFSSVLKKRGKLDPSSPRRPRPASPDGRTARSGGWLALRAAVSGSRQQVNGPGRGVLGAWGRRGARYKGARPAAGATKQPAWPALPICVPRPLPPRTPSPALGDQVGPGGWVRGRWLGQSGPAGTGGGKACRAGEVKAEPLPFFRSARRARWVLWARLPSTPRSCQCLATPRGTQRPHRQPTPVSGGLILGPSVIGI